MLSDSIFLLSFGTDDTSLLITMRFGWACPNCGKLKMQQGDASGSFSGQYLPNTTEKVTYLVAEIPPEPNESEKIKLLVNFNSRKYLFCHNLPDKYIVMLTHSQKNLYSLRVCPTYSTSYHLHLDTE